MSTQNLPVPLFGRDGEPCGVCRAPLAGNQRYCLYCGTRRPEARLEFLEVLTSDVAVQQLSAYPAAGGYGPPGPGGPGSGVGAGPEPGVNGWLKANSGVLGLAGLLLGTLLVGLLLGHWATSGAGSQTKAAAPQVIRVAGGAPAAATGAAAGAAAGASAAAATDKAAASGAKTKKKAAKAAAADAAVVAVPKNSVKADSVTKLKGKAYDDALKNAVKKGAPISSGNGKLPPKDDKPAGGGSSFEEIG